MRPTMLVEIGAGFVVGATGPMGGRGSAAEVGIGGGFEGVEDRDLSVRSERVVSASSYETIHRSRE